MIRQMDLLLILLGRARENGRWRGSQKGTSGRGPGGRVCEGPRAINDTGRIVQKNSHNPDEIYNCVRKDGVNSKYLKSVNQKLEEESDKKINSDYPFVSCLMGKQEANAMAVHEKKKQLCSD